MQCSICLSDIESDCDACINKLFECDHVYHIGCIQKWSGTCPNCRSTRKSVPSVLPDDDAIKAIYGIEFGDTLEVKFTDITCTYYGTFKHIHRCGDKMFLHIDKFRIFRVKTKSFKLVEPIGTSLYTILALIYNL